jgi:DNA replication protein DnaC
MPAFPLSTAWAIGDSSRHRVRLRSCRLAAANILIIDDFALQPLDETATADFYELTVARHRKHATIVTSNRTPG